jgi:energy-coupling factor transporter ATP-binding protein EcfA2
MRNGKQDSIHLVRLTVNNYRKLRFAELRLDAGGRLVRVTGPNAAGKTSLLRGLAELFGGAKAVKDPEQAIHTGADSGEVEAELSNGFYVEKSYSPEHPKGELVVRGPDGGRYNQSKLNEWTGPRAFDPLAFISLDPAKQADTLLRLGTDPDLPAKLATLKAQRKAAYEKRTPHIVALRNARAVQQPEGERPEPVDTSAEMRRLAELQQKQALLEQAQRDVGEIEKRIEAGRLVVADLEADVAELEKKLAEARATAEAGRAKLARLEQELNRRAEALCSLSDYSEAIRAVQGHIADAQTINEQLKPWYAWDKAQEDEREASTQADLLTEEIESYDRAKGSLLANSGIDIPGLSFDDEGAPLLNGLPLSVASGREKIDLSVAVALKSDPQLRIALLDEANDLDLEALRRLNELAVEEDFQVLAVRIGLEGPGEIVVQDGFARTREEVEQQSLADARFMLGLPDREDERAEQDALAGAAEAEAAAMAQAQYDALLDSDPQLAF